MSACFVISCEIFLPQIAVSVARVTYVTYTHDAVAKMEGCPGRCSEMAVRGSEPWIQQLALVLPP